METNDIQILKKHYVGKYIKPLNMKVRRLIYWDTSDPLSKRYDDGTVSEDWEKKFDDENSIEALIWEKHIKNSCDVDLTKYRKSLEAGCINLFITNLSKVNLKKPSENLRKVICETINPPSSQHSINSKSTSSPLTREEQQAQKWLEQEIRIFISYALKGDKEIYNDIKIVTEKFLDKKDTKWMDFWKIYEIKKAEKTVDFVYDKIDVKQLEEACQTIDLLPLKIYKNIQKLEQQIWETYGTGAKTKKEERTLFLKSKFQTLYKTLKEIDEYSEKHGLRTSIRLSDNTNTNSPSNASVSHTSVCGLSISSTPKNPHTPTPNRIDSISINFSGKTKK